MSWWNWAVIVAGLVTLVGVFVLFIFAAFSAGAAEDEWRAEQIAMLEEERGRDARKRDTG